VSLPSDFYDIGSTFIEGFMTDTCTIRRDKPGVWDDVMDEDTLELVTPVADQSVVYTGGCVVKPISTRDLPYEEADQAVFRKVYEILIPRSAPETILGDEVTIDNSVKDATLTGEVFRVMEVRKSSHHVYSYLRCEDVQQDYNPTNPMT